MQIFKLDSASHLLVLSVTLLQISSVLQSTFYLSKISVCLCCHGDDIPLDGSSHSSSNWAVWIVHILS